MLGSVLFMVVFFGILGAVFFGAGNIQSVALRTAARVSVGAFAAVAVYYAIQYFHGK